MINKKTMSDDVPCYGCCGFLDYNLRDCNALLIKPTAICPEFLEFYIYPMYVLSIIEGSRVPTVQVDKNNYIA